MGNPRVAIKRRHWLALVLAHSGVSASHAAAPTPQPWPRQKPQPALAMPALDGALWTLSEQAGHTILLNFWASWCEPCRAEMPALERLSAAYAPAGLHVLAVNYRESPDTVRRFVAHTGTTLPVLMDGDGSVAKALGIGIFPTTVAIDRRGRILFTVTGECAWDQEPATRWLRAALQSA